jgi:hypothetical protein
MDSTLFISTGCYSERRSGVPMSIYEPKNTPSSHPASVPRLIIRMYAQPPHLGNALAGAPWRHQLNRPSHRLCLAVGSVLVSRRSPQRRKRLSDGSALPRQSRGGSTLTFGKKDRAEGLASRRGISTNVFASRYRGTASGQVARPAYS